MKFDLYCFCLVAFFVISGVGRGASLRQGLSAAIHMQDGEGGLRKDTGGEDIPDGSMEGEKKMVAITFDDGPHPTYTPKMLEALRERGVKATFFLLGEEVEKYPEIVKQIEEEGHLIGNHSYKHEQLSKLTMEQACTQVNRTNDLIYQVTGTYPSYLRPPFGDWHKELDGKVNMVEVLWDVDTLDT
ncbi:polysaccharide deacetylase family protein [Lachnospiraceae bacterium 29-84]